MSSKAVFGTLVIFLQNEAGNKRWTPTPEKIKELVMASKPKDPISTPSPPS